jgi:hypothetical protein
MAVSSVFTNSFSKDYFQQKQIEGAASTGGRGKYVNFVCCPFVAALYISNVFLGAVCKFVRSDYELRLVCLSFPMSVSPSDRIEKLGFQWRDFHEILILFFYFMYLFIRLYNISTSSCAH